MIAAERIGYAVGRKSLVAEVSLSLARGELLAVIGPNGAGKSTLLRMLAGELAPAAGTISLDGKPLAAWAPAEIARRRAVLPQSSTLTFPFSVAEVALLGRAPHNGGIDTRQDLIIVQHALAVAGVGHLAARRYPSLSGGERQRVHLARVLAQLMTGPGRYEPGFLLLDEPVTSLD
ncbi:MAG: ATP-binding cassette domain-containing protein, partial [Rhodospirillaceae bacterium]|nr:ATP-binding cassette domain-containing protein [Rhodospirillaceae bacterium]